MGVIWVGVSLKFDIDLMLQRKKQQITYSNDTRYFTRKSETDNPLQRKIIVGKGDDAEEYTKDFEKHLT